MHTTTVDYYSSLLMSCHSSRRDRTSRGGGGGGTRDASADYDRSTLHIEAFQPVNQSKTTKAQNRAPTRHDSSVIFNKRRKWSSTPNANTYMKKVCTAKQRLKKQSPFPCRNLEKMTKASKKNMRNRASKPSAPISVRASRGQHTINIYTRRL